MAAFPDMLKRDRLRWGMREWRFDLSVREYRELEAGNCNPTFETWDRICKLYGWPQTFIREAKVSGRRPRRTIRADERNE